MPNKSRSLVSFSQFIVTHTVKGFGIVNKAEIDVFLELSCFFYDPGNVGNLISGSSALSKTSLNIWKFTVHVLLKPDLENFEHYFTSVWDECNCAVVWALFYYSCSLFVLYFEIMSFPFSCVKTYFYRIIVMVNGSFLYSSCDKILKHTYFAPTITSYFISY